MTEYNTEELLNITSIAHVILLGVFLWVVIDTGVAVRLGFVSIYVVMVGVSLVSNYSAVTERTPILFLLGITVIGGCIGIVLVTEKPFVSVLFVCIVVWLFLDGFTSDHDGDDEQGASRTDDSGEYIRPATLLSIRFELGHATRPLTVGQISEIVGVSETRVRRSLGILSNDGVVIEDDGRYWLNSGRRGVRAWIPVGLTLAKHRIVRPFKHI